MQLTLKKEDGTEIQAELRPLRVREYPAAFAAHDRDEEWRLIALCTVAQTPALAPDWPLELNPESYEQAVSAIQAENPTFFAWCARRWANRGVRDGVARMVAAGLGSQSPGGTSSPRSRPMPI